MTLHHEDLSSAWERSSRRCECRLATHGHFPDGWCTSQLRFATWAVVVDPSDIGGGANEGAAVVCQMCARLVGLTLKRARRRTGEPRGFSVGIRR